MFFVADLIGDVLLAYEILHRGNRLIFSIHIGVLIFSACDSH